MWSWWKYLHPSGDSFNLWYVFWQAQTKQSLENLEYCIELKGHWPHSLLTWMSYVQVTTAKTKLFDPSFAEKKRNFWMNWIEIELVPATDWTLEEQGAKELNLWVYTNKQLLTTVCLGIFGCIFPIQVIYQAKTNTYVGVTHISNFIHRGILLTSLNSYDNKEMSFQSIPDNSIILEYSYDIFIYIIKWFYFT